jgi:hypothetical protein
MTNEPIDDLGDDGEVVVQLLHSAATIIFRTADHPEQAEKIPPRRDRGRAYGSAPQRPAAEHGRQSVG